MNGMERKVAERSAALECNGKKRKPLAAGFGRKTIHGLHLRRVVGFFVVFPGTIPILQNLNRQVGIDFYLIVISSFTKSYL